jgi:predicted MFS family arabinose efflux permease
MPEWRASHSAALGSFTRASFIVTPQRPHSLTPGLLALLATASFASAAAMHFQSPMLGAMAEEFQVDAAAAGWIATLTFAGYLGGMVFIVPLGDRLDKRAVILGQMCGLLLSSIALGLAPTLAAAALASVVLGASACLTQSVIPVVIDLGPETGRGRLVGTLLTALFLGILFGRLAGGHIAEHYGWRWSYALSCVLMLAVLAPLAMRLPRMPAKTALPYGALLRSLGGLLRERAELRRIAAIQFCLGICYGGFWGTIAPMLALLHHLGPAQAGLIGIPGSAGTLVARPAGRWMDRRGPYPVVMTAVCLVLAAFVVLQFAAWSVGVVIAGAILLDCGIRASVVANQTRVTSVATETRSRVNTVFGASIWGGNAMGAFIASMGLAHFGWNAACSVAMLSAAVAIGLQWTARPRNTPAQAA